MYLWQDIHSVSSNSTHLASRINLDICEVLNEKHFC